MTEIAIRTRALTKNYGSGNGLFGLDLEIESGEVFGFLGPNGAGKSTTMRLLLDLIAPSAGSATLLGLDSRDSSLEIRRQVRPGALQEQEDHLRGDVFVHRRAGASASDVQPCKQKQPKT